MKVKTLVASGCSFTMGGGLDNPDYHRFFESNAVSENGIWEENAGKNGKKFCYKNNYPYFLSKLLKVDKYHNFSIGGGGLYRTIQSIFTFLRAYNDDPNDLQIIYQIPSVNRVEVAKNHIDYVLFESINCRENDLFLKQWMKYFYNLETHWLNTLLELDKLNELCKARNIPLMLIDWNCEFSDNGPKPTFISKLLTEQAHNYYSLYRQICKSAFENSLIKMNEIINDLPFVDCRDILMDNSNKIHRIVDGNVEVIDHHLDPNGAKLLANYIFEKKFKEN
jgi:hypothetical protein